MTTHKRVQHADTSDNPIQSFQHKIQDGEVLQDQITTTESDKSHQSTITTVTLDYIFHSAYNNTLKCIKEDPIMYNIFGESTIVQIVKSNPDSVEVKTFFYDLFMAIFNSNPNLSLNHDGELFVTKFHALRHQRIHRSLWSNGFTTLDNTTFIQIVMLELINQLLTQQTIQEQKSSI
ncbi:KRAB [Mytilus edulis]|uniref:KRAB n=1 Tax=Mytilus edulis TaxID=6550 RepID=A0A8S3TMV5_MYTED|nr:KRAB [Mytilus edulis]